MPDVTLTEAECKALHDLIGQLAGGNPENVFAWDGTDDAADPTTAACVKVYRAAGKSIPEGL
jgi:hypothetical protein